MKKLFVLFLLVALVPFTVGCSLWGQDEDLDVIATTTESVVVTVPASEVSGVNLRAAVSYETLKLFVNGIEFVVSTSPAPVYNETSDTWAVTFTAKLTESQIAAISDAVVPVVLTSGTTTILTTSTTLAVDGATAPAIVVTVANDGTVSVTVDGAAVINTAAIPEIPEFKVASVTVMIGQTETELNATTYTAIASLTPTFTVELAKAYTNTLSTVAWKLKVTNKTSGVDFVLDSTNTAHAGLFAVTAVGTDKMAVTVKLNTATGAQPSSLTSGENYEVQLIATDLTDGTATLSQVSFRFQA